MLHSVNGVRLNVLDEGEGHPILFLHGMGGCWRDWEPQLDSLSASYRCIAIEHRGHGRSERPLGHYSTRLFADDAMVLLDQLGIAHAHVVGLSMGGMVAQHIAAARPDLVDALVLADTGAFMHDGPSAFLAQWAEQVRAEGLPDSHGVVGDSVPGWSAATLRDHPEVARNNIREAEGTDPDAWYRAAIAVTEHDTRSVLGRITAPTLLFWGADDHMVPVDLAGPLQAGIADTRLIVLDDAGHVCNLAQPEAFNAALIEFLDAHAG
jgi:pimeloyl-ACP methyl ester carboxylesterase